MGSKMSDTIYIVNEELGIDIAVHIKGESEFTKERIGYNVFTFLNQNDVDWNIIKEINYIADTEINVVTKE
jgi:hypothetical protein